MSKKVLPPQRTRKKKLPTTYAETEAVEINESSFSSELLCRVAEATHRATVRISVAIIADYP